MTLSRLALPCTLVCGLLLAPDASAQSPLVSIEVSPNPVMVDGTLTVTMTAATDGIGVLLTPLGTDCGLTLRGTRPGTGIAFCGGFAALCGPNTRLINRCESITLQDTVCSMSFSPGLHYARVQYKNPAGSFVNEWVPFEVAGSGNPILSATGNPQVGGSTTLNLQSSAGRAGQTYLVLASFSTNVGFTYAGQFFALDPDGLLFGTLAAPNTFPVNSLGVLDAGGNSPAMPLAVPPVPELSCFPLKFQGIVGLSQPSLAASSVVSLTIQQ